VVVVTGHARDAVERLLASREVTLVHNPLYGEGLSGSLKAGLAALPPDAAGALICLADMPLVSADHLDRLIAEFAPDAGRAIVVPTRHGRRGNPVLWHRRFFAEMQQLAGDVGARHLIGVHRACVTEVEMPDDAALTDIDTPAALADAGQLDKAE
jgi:molybdenum cofactor cytidylyltransferase